MKNKTPDFQKNYIKKANGKPNFARVFLSLFDSEAYLALPPAARDIYVGLIIATGGKTQCNYPYSVYIKRCSKDTFHRSIKALEQNGFIEVVRFKKTANVYKLSEKWKEYKPP